MPSTKELTKEHRDLLVQFGKMMSGIMSKYYEDRTKIEDANDKSWDGPQPFPNRPPFHIFSGILGEYVSIMEKMLDSLNQNYHSDGEYFVPAVDSCMLFHLFFIYHDPCDNERSITYRGPEFKNKDMEKC